MIEVGCWMHARRYVYKALESDQRMGPALHLIARVYAVEDRAKALALSAEQRLALRQRVSIRLMERLHKYLLKLKQDVVPKSSSGAAVRYALNQWEALTRFLEDGELVLPIPSATPARMASSAWARSTRQTSPLPAAGRGATLQRSEKGWNEFAAKARRSARKQKGNNCKGAGNRNEKASMVVYSGESAKQWES